MIKTATAIGVQKCLELVFGMMQSAAGAVIPNGDGNFSFLPGTISARFKHGFNGDLGEVREEDHAGTLYLPNLGP